MSSASSHHHLLPSHHLLPHPNNPRNWIRHCFHHLLFSLWRRRPLLLAVVMITAVVVLALQYQSVVWSPASLLLSSSPSSMAIPLDRPHHRGRHHEFSASAVESGSLPLRTLFPKRNLSSMDGGLHPQQDDYHAHPRGDVVETQGEGRISNNQPRDYVQQQQQHPQSSQDNYKSLNQYSLNNNNRVANGDQAQQQPSSSGYIPSLRVVHFDLKGAPPKISYFKQIFPLLKDAGANAILIEYEEMFPFWGPISSITSPAAYSKDDIRAIQELAKIYSFELIPLVQTFGHLEFALKLEEFRHLRESDMYPEALCPSKNESFALVQTLIDQIMAMHPFIKWLHIGSDEVFHMGYCDICRYKERDVLFLQHVTKVARYVREKYNVIPIIWDDMLRSITPDKMRELGQLGVEPMVWTYVKDVYRFIPYSTWLSYTDNFHHVWAASAFKGAFGETLTVPNAKMHLENNVAWLEVMAEQTSIFKGGGFRGIVITGWQRYDHMGVLCETLPAGLPSLILNLLTVSNGKFDPTLWKKFDQIMSCPGRSSFYSGGTTAPDLDQDLYLWSYAGSCLFPGSSVFRLTQHTADVVKRVTDYEYDVTIHKAWMTAYNVRHNISNPFRVDEGLQDHSGIYYSLTSLVKEAEDSLKEVFDKFTVSEWIEENIYPYILRMEKIMKDAVDLKKARVWPKRPLPPLADLQRFMSPGSGNRKR